MPGALGVEAMEHEESRKEKQKKRFIKGHQETFGSSIYVHYLHCADGSVTREWGLLPARCPGS